VSPTYEPPPQLVYSTRYEPFGNARHTAFGNTYTAQPLGYTGAPLDPESGLLYLNARYYAPRNARFLQRDSVFGSDADPASLNRYAYARNNPMVFTDPTGHQVYGPEGYNPWGCQPSPSCWATPTGQIQTLTAAAYGEGAFPPVPRFIVLGALPPMVRVVGPPSSYITTVGGREVTGAYIIENIGQCWQCRRTVSELAQIGARLEMDHFWPNAFYRVRNGVSVQPPSVVSSEGRRLPRRA
jgi:RHS repeat-associated protein